MSWRSHLGTKVSHPFFPGKHPLCSRLGVTQEGRTMKLRSVDNSTDWLINLLSA